MWHKPEALFPINPSSPVHPNKGALTHFLAPAAGLCFIAHVLRPRWTKRSREQGQDEANSPRLSRLRPPGSGPRQWRHLMEAARAAGGPSRHGRAATAPGLRGARPATARPQPGPGHRANVSPGTSQRANPARLLTGISMGKPAIRGAQVKLTDLEASAACWSSSLRFARAGLVKLRADLEPNSSR